MRDYGPVRPGFGRAFSAASLVGISALSLAPLPAAIAQEASEAPPTGLEEIIVTSRYREENLQTTPLTISAFTGEALELRSLDNLEDIAVVVPNMFIRPNVSNFGPNNTVGLRNVIQVDFLYAFEPATGVYIDDVYHGTLTGSSIDLLDLERVEVLRGPQGTLFGKNSIGGAMRMVSRQPQGDDTGYVEATYGDYDRIDIKGVYDMALSDTLALRVSGVSKHQNGYMETVDFTCDMVRRGTPELAGIDDGIVGALGIVHTGDPEGPQSTWWGADLFLVVGSETFLDLLSWREPRRIAELAQLVVVPRVGSAFDPDSAAARKIVREVGQEPLIVRATSLPISASDLRRRVREGRSLAFRLPDAVIGYIATRGLYRA